MFLDISGFSVMTDALMGQGREGSETLAEMMRAVFDPIVDAIFAQGGVIVGYAGDSISAIYQLESDEVSAALRALASAQHIQQGLAAQPYFETPYGSFRISAKIGLAAGLVSWGVLSSRKRDKAVYFFRGAGVDDAAQAEHQAAAGEIVLADGIRKHLAGHVSTNPLDHGHALLKVSGSLPVPRPVTLPAIVPSKVAIFAPREIVTQDLKGEFRQTVHLCMRIPDLPDDELQGFIHTFYDLQGNYGGLIDRIDFGDKGCNMSVVWGAPVAHENDIDRALNFILDLRARVDFPVTAGLTYYSSYAGYVGGHLCETYTAYGWGMNLAARFMMSASENDIWLDERISRRVRERFHLEPVGETAFKGFAQKQKVFVLRGRKSGAEVLFRGNFLGRQAELQALADFVAPLASGKSAGVAAIWGEAGMGKSRLVHEFRRSPVVRTQNCLWALCQCDEIVRRSFDPFRYWLLRYFEIPLALDHPTRLQKFSSRLDELINFTTRPALVAELKRSRSFLAALVELDWPDSPHAVLDAQGRYDNTILALISLLKAESLRQSLVLFLEDAQYLDEDSMAFLTRLKRALAADAVPHPIAVLIAVRSQGSAELLAPGLVDESIDLTSLSDEYISSMCGDFLGQPAAGSLAKLVNDRAEGNPFFAEQILRYLQEQQALEVDAAGQWMVSPSRTLSPLPADTIAMLVARLDKLAGRVKEVIQAASVLGRVFELPVLARMLPHEVSLRGDIAAAEQAGIWSPLGENRIIFDHALLRDVAYNMQLQSRRQELHARAFEALRDAFGREIPRHYGELAYHSEQAALPEQARHYLELAGNAARDDYQNAPALDFYRRALAILPKSDMREQYRLHRECEKIVTEHGTLEERNREIDALQALAAAIGDRGNMAEVMLLRSALASSRGDYEESAELGAQAKRIALEAGRHDVAIGAYRSLLDAYYQRAMYGEAVEHGEAGIALARSQNDMQDQASILNILGLAVLEMKNPSAARTYFEQSMSIFRAEDNLRGVANALGNLGSVAGYQGNYSAALDYYEQSLRITREIGSRKAECVRLGNMGWLCGLLGDYGRAKGFMEQALLIAREIGDRYTETLSLINLSSHAGAMGEFGSAIQYAEQALLLARQSNDRNAQAWALTYLGHGLFECGMLEPAQNAYREALQLRQELDQTALATEPAAGLARISLLRGDSGSAQSYVNTVLAQLEQDGTLEGTDQPLRVYLSCYLVLSGMEDPRASRIINTAHDMLRTRANGISDPSGRQLYLEKITYNREILSLWERRHPS